MGVKQNGAFRAVFVVHVWDRSICAVTSGWIPARVRPQGHMGDTEVGTRNKHQRTLTRKILFLKIVPSTLLLGYNLLVRTTGCFDPLTDGVQFVVPGTSFGSNGINPWVERRSSWVVRGPTSCGTPKKWVRHLRSSFGRPRWWSSWTRWSARGSRCRRSAPGPGASDRRSRRIRRRAVAAWW